MPDLLEAIIGATKRDLIEAEREVRLSDLEKKAESMTSRGDLFYSSMSASTSFNVIAECKSSSPSRGVLKHDYRPGLVAKSYEVGGAAAISVLTEPSFFGGSLDDLDVVRSAVEIPVLRKDFIISRYQIFQAVVAGADAILLIVAALSDKALKLLLEEASRVGLAVLVEVHDKKELSRAIEAGAVMIGVNNRNLRTLVVDTSASYSLIERIPKPVIAIAESGLSTASDLRSLREVGYSGFLIGESLMTADNPGEKLSGILAECEVV
mgnify:CR=1 FL=1